VATVFEVRDEIWEVVEPMIPPVKVPERQGRRPVADRVCFEAIVFVMDLGDRVGSGLGRMRWVVQRTFA
jgi:transposase